MYIHAYIYVNTYISMYIHAFIYVKTYVSMYIHASTHTTLTLYHPSFHLYPSLCSSYLPVPLSTTLFLMSTSRLPMSFFFILNFIYICLLVLLHHSFCLPPKSLYTSSLYVHLSRNFTIFLSLLHASSAV